MLKKIILGGVCLAAAASLSAATLTPEQALARLNGSAMRVPARGAAAPKLVHTAFMQTGSPAVYVFNRADNAGYMVLGADDIAYPVLAYADEGSFDADNMAPAMKWWLEEYGRQIEYAASHGAKPASAFGAPSRSTKEPIEPMLKTSWDQIRPYNGMCPLDGKVRTYTGCVATSMAQVMKYWEFPEKGSGNISYTAASLGKKLSLSLGLKKFDWKHMLPVYANEAYSATDSTAVAYLMKACGYAVHMDYGTDSSGALAMDVQPAMVKYFNYDPNSLYTLRLYYSSPEWADLIYESLKNGCPVIYGGASTIGGGHSFVCDGYDGNGLYHFNWGWTGMSNGYFSLEALNPESLGSGGGSGGGYNFTQDAILNLRPNTTGATAPERPVQLTQMGSLVSDIQDGYIRFDLDLEGGAMWVNYTPVEMFVNFGAKFEPQGNTGGKTIYQKVGDRAWQINPGYGAGPQHIKPAVELAKAGLSDGTYKVSIVTLDDKDANAQWMPTRAAYGYYDYVILEKKGSTYSVKNLEAPVLKIVSAKFLHPLYYGCLNEVRIEVENTSDIELSSGFAPIIADEEATQLIGESVLISVPPKSKVTKVWVTDLYATSQYFTVDSPKKMAFSFMDEGSYYIYANQFAEEVEVLPTPAAPKLEIVSSPVVVGAPVDTPSLSDGRKVNIYGVTEPSTMPITATVKLTEGYFAYPLLAVLAQPSTSQPGYVEILTLATCNAFIDTPGSTFDFKALLSYPQAQADKMYNLIIAYGLGSQPVPLSGGVEALIYMIPSGVEGVTADNSGITVAYIRPSSTVAVSAAAGVDTVEVHTLDGIKIASAAGGDGNVTVDLQGHTGVVLVSVRDKSGAVKTVKIAL